MLATHAPFVEGLTPAEVEVLEGLVQLFLHDKTFEGCGGLEMTETIRVTVAAHACRLLLAHPEDPPFPGLDVIRVYPSTWRTTTAERLGPTHSEGHPSYRLGESSPRGFVVLSWAAVEDAVRGERTGDGHNVVLHELAHQLDTQDGVADGAPPLPRSLYGPWARVLGEAYAELQDDVRAGRPSALDPYGATSPAEFFAVATEAFFEAPHDLERREPDLYGVLAQYYGQDPAR